MLLPPCLALDAAQKAFAGAGIAIFGMHGEAGELAGAFVGERIQRCAAHDHAIVLEHEEATDLHLEQLARALDQRAIGLERLDQLQDAADVVDARRRAAARADPGSPWCRRPRA